MITAQPSPPDSSSTDIYYIHRGPIPRYLLQSMENTRVFNPVARIFLIGDHSHAQLSRLGVTLVPISELPQNEIEAFQKSYKHTSGNPEGFERFCFTRWFLLKEAMLVNNSSIVLHLDSDCMIFDTTQALTQRLLPASALCYYGSSGNPHVALFRKEGLVSLTKTLLTLFDSDLYHNWSKTNWLADRQYFCDMTGLIHHLRTHPAQVNSQITWNDAMLEQTMSEADGCELWPGPKKLKRVQWREKDGKLIPHLRNLAGNQWMRALALHYKGASKRRMRRFNTLASTHPGRLLKKFIYNHIPPVNLLSALKR
ncbi:MAG: hypothetical protein J0L73_10990 [Verrucomicrobia bacterium]|nr:hypothetical protein [Verrucomicrobiota bacterium]